MEKTTFKILRGYLYDFFFWALVWLFFFSFFSVGSQNIEFIFWFSLILSAITIVSTYHFTHKLIPNYLIQKKYKLFTLYSCYTLVFIVCSVLTTVVFGFVFFFNLEFQKMPELTKNSGVIIVCVLLIVALASSFKILKYNYQSLEEKKSIENKFLQAQLKLKEQELKFLKMQIHPHFLFNTLNTIYGFALKKSDETPDMILKLSNLLDYILYQVDKPKVFLNDEVNHIKNYIALEKSRFQDSLNIDFSILDFNTNIQVPPMLLLPFVENAFKHGKQKDGILSVKIKLDVINDCLVFELKNSAVKSLNSRKGIGLENIKSRLEMIYGETYLLNVNQTTNSFIVELKTPIGNEK